MKRFVLILVCLLTACGMYSQIVSSRSETLIIKSEEKKPRVPIKLEFYAKAGLNIMNTDWSGFNIRPTDITNKISLGFDLALGLMSHFRPSNPSDFYWGGEIGLSQVGGGFDEFTNKWEECTYPSQNLRVLAAYVAPGIGWNKSLTKTLCLDLHFNPGFSLPFKDQDVDYIYRHKDHIYNGAHSVGTQFYLLFKIGAGVWIKKFNIDISYKYQTYMRENSYNNFILSLGYKF